MKALLRVVSALTAFCFVGTQALALPLSQAPQSLPVAQATSTAGSAGMSPSDITALVHWHVPESYGSVQERWQGTAKKVIFHIQDTHANYESQMHSAQILETLLKGRFKDKIRLIAVEGAASPIDLKRIKI